MNYKIAMDRHMSNLSRQVGHNVGDKYSLIVNSNELTEAYIKMRNELKYPLMIDSRYRRAIVYNKMGIEEKINK